jgi:hypothetical protein
MALMERARSSINNKLSAPDSALKILHIRCDSGIKQTLLDGGFPGDFLEHSYTYCYGPVTTAADQFERGAGFIADLTSQFMKMSFSKALGRRRAEEHALAVSAKRYELIVPWMEHDCFDQLVLVGCLAHYENTNPPIVLELLHTIERMQKLSDGILTRMDGPIVRQDNLSITDV